MVSFRLRTRIPRGSDSGGMRVRGFDSRVVSRWAWSGVATSLVFVFAACAPVSDRARAAPPSPAPPSLPTVVLVSLDGTRPADLRPDRLPSLVALAEQGAAAHALVPVDPTNTFPNHVSLATGVRPEVHRLVNNAFVDPERGRFRRSAPHEWIEAEPIWSVAERNGVRAASYYWVGSEGPWSGGPGPSETRKFSSRTLEKTKVDRILAWLAEPDPARRPRLVVAWFHGADHAGHDHGPDAPEVTRALAPQDAEIARLVREMEARGAFETTTLIFVSDHGMVGAERRIPLQDRLREAGLRASVLGIGGFASVLLEGRSRGPEGRADAVATARALGLDAFAREEAPADWHVDDPRFGDVVVRAPIGTAIVSTLSRDLGGFHGYDAEAPEMAALLVARGRGVRPGTKLGRVSNLSVAPTVLRLLGLPVPAAMEAPVIDGLLVGVAAGDAEEGERR